MTPFRTYAIGAALTLVLAGSEAHAAWDNVFQVCCFRCRNRTSYSAPPVVANAACNSCCSTSYVQRCYYEPVTSYKTVMEPVTSYRTSYYYEPVCSYRSSCYYDPCTGSSVQVTTPVTSYRLRSQCNAVVSYVQRCVPVTAYRPRYYLEAVTSCAPPPPCPTPCSPTAAIPGVSEPPPADNTRIAPTPVPGVDESRSGFPPTGTARPAPPSAAPAAPGRVAPPTKLENVVSRPTNGAHVTGQVVNKNSIFPVSNARLLFVSKEEKGRQQPATADTRGRFNVALPSGGWDIYMNRGDGKLEYHSSIDVKDNQERKFRVVSR